MYSQNRATIKFTNVQLLKDRTIYFKVNGAKLKATNANYSIRVNPKKVLDTIIYAFDPSFKKKRISFAKFRKGKVYVISINPCSGYELFSEKKQRKGKVKILKAQNTTNKTLNFSSDLVEIPLIKENFNKSFRYYPSGNCRYSYQTFQLKKEDKVLDTRNFHFLHGETLKIKLIGNKIYFKL